MKEKLLFFFPPLLSAYVGKQACLFFSFQEREGAVIKQKQTCGTATITTSDRSINQLLAKYQKCCPMGVRLPTLSESMLLQTIHLTGFPSDKSCVYVLMFFIK